MKSSEYDSNLEHRHVTKSVFIKDYRRKRNSCQSCCKRFDDLIMRPFLIHNYEYELINKKEEFLELFMKEGDIWEKLYMKEEYDPLQIEEVRTQRGYSMLKHIEAKSRRNSNFQNPFLRNSGASHLSGGVPIVNASPGVRSP